MIIFGLDAFHGDSAAALVRDGVLVAAAEEERFRRLKHWVGFRITVFREPPKRDSLRCRCWAMTAKTVTRAHLYEAVYQKTGLSRAECVAQVELVLKEITGCLERGEAVKLSGFGVFVVRSKGQRIGRNPKTGKAAVISPRRVMAFKPSDILKQRINAAKGPQAGEVRMPA